MTRRQTALKRISTRAAAGTYRLPVVLYVGDDGYIVAQVPALPGCISQGKTEREALANIAEAAELCLEGMDAEGWSLPDSFSIAHIEITASNG